MDYTKGKWEVTKHNPLSNWVVDVNPSDLINRIPIAQCFENVADANLIASAPRLLEELSSLIHRFRVISEIAGLPTDKIDSELEGANKAIAKAEGK
ncbi:hypothetical protein LCGC14_0514460 [marine sediment metagenome]|uniref:Uncharacterized protein n=1 Tax=marine sediment metagenome TaxID=412755 RepID=A0A0F9SIM4_9ZZZZ